MAITRRLIKERSASLMKMEKGSFILVNEHICISKNKRQVVYDGLALHMAAKQKRATVIPLERWQIYRLCVF